jgi:alanyl-tRNA synthetase
MKPTTATWLSASIQDVRSFWTRRTFEEWEPAGVCPDSPLFKSQFNPSATHVQIYNILTGRLPATPRKNFIIESVFRHFDIGAVGDRTHLSFFKMMGVVQILEPQVGRDKLIATRRQFLHFVLEHLESLGISRENLIATYFKGGSIFGQEIPTDTAGRDQLLEAGLHESNLVPIGGTFGFLYTPVKHDVAGYRSDLYFQDSAGLLCELATLDFCEYLSIDGRMAANDRFLLLGYYAGLERLVSTRYDADIWKVPSLERALNLSVEMLNTRHSYDLSHSVRCIVEKDLKVLVDRVRAVSNVLACGQSCDKSDRGNVLRRLIQDIVRIMRTYIGQVDREFLLELASVISETDDLPQGAVSRLVQMCSES